MPYFTAVPSANGQDGHIIANVTNHNSTSLVWNFTGNNAYTGSNAARVFSHYSTQTNTMGKQVAKLSQAWIQFSGITIPQNSTINTATLKMRMAQSNAFTYVGCRLQFDSAKTPAIPTQLSELNFRGRFTNASNPPTSYRSVTPTNVGNTGSPGSFALQSVNVQPVIQQLVNTHDYVGGKMMFLTAPGGPYPVTTTISLGNAERAYIAMQDWEPTVAGPELFIDYTAPDSNPPTPVGFDSAPAAISTTEIAMTAQVATDPEGNGPVEYNFEETSGNPGGSDSGWQTSTSYTDTGLTPGTQYSYTVRTRDALNNTSSPSAASNATTPLREQDKTPYRYG